MSTIGRALVPSVTDWNGETGDIPLALHSRRARSENAKSMIRRDPH